MMGGLSDRQEGNMGGSANERNILWEEYIMEGISDGRII